MQNHDCSLTNKKSGKVKGNLKQGYTHQCMIYQDPSIIKSPFTLKTPTFLLKKSKNSMKLKYILKTERKIWKKIVFGKIVFFFLIIGKWKLKKGKNW